MRVPAGEILDRAPQDRDERSASARSTRFAPRTRSRCWRRPSRQRRSTPSRRRWQRSRATPSTSWTAPPPISAPPSRGSASGLERRRRDRSLPTRLLSWLFGFELKLRQYEDGKRFCDGVVAAAGIAALNSAWEGPETLPTVAELNDPNAWVARVVMPAAAT